MTQNAQVQCINKSNRSSAHERITHIGGSSPSQWKITVADAIRHIEAKEWDFYVSVNGVKVWIVIAISAAGNKYLKTQNDGEQPNNLLSLPECP